MKKKLALDEGLSILKQGIAKAMLILDGHATSALFTCEEYMKLYDCVYQICCQNYPNEYFNQLYELFKEALEESITSRVIPALKDKTHVCLLNKLCNMWGKYKVMAKCLGGFFLYLDRHFVEDSKTAPLNHLSVCCFHDLINQDRDEDSACSDLLKHVSTFFMEIGNGKMHCYDNFETAVLSSTAMYYEHLISKLLLHNTPTEYMMKAQRCFSQEKERASQFLTQTSVEKLLKVVEEQLLGETAVKALNSYEQRKAECGDGSIPYQDMLQRCAGLNLGDGSSQG